MSDITSINYEAMQTVSAQFEQEAARIQRVNQQVESHLNTLKGGGWLADAATAFYQIMESEVCPGIQRLQAALMQASQTSREIGNVLKQAEEEACQCLPGQ